jgi:Ca2+-binding RTX toxin-like protein
VGNDTFTGGVSGVRGSDYDDQITGNGESDKLDGWLGNDTLTGGMGEDTFIYSVGTTGSRRGGGADHVVGFELGVDHLDLTGVTTVHTFTALSALMTDSGSDVVINFGGGNTVTVEGIHKADLVADHVSHPADFLFA